MVCNVQWDLQRAVNDRVIPAGKIPCDDISTSWLLSTFMLYNACSIMIQCWIPICPMSFQCLSFFLMIFSKMLTWACRSNVTKYENSTHTYEKHKSKKKNGHQDRLAMKSYILERQHKKWGYLLLISAGVLYFWHYSHKQAYLAIWGSCSKTCGDPLSCMSCLFASLASPSRRSPGRQEFGDFPSYVTCGGRLMVHWTTCAYGRPPRIVDMMNDIEHGLTK